MGGAYCPRRSHDSSFRNVETFALVVVVHCLPLHDLCISLEQADSQICTCTLRWDGHDNWSDPSPNQDK